MKAPEEDRRTGGETAEARIGRFVYGFLDELGSADVLALCGGKGSGSFECTVSVSRFR